MHLHQVSGRPLTYTEINPNIGGHTNIVLRDDDRMQYAEVMNHQRHVVMERNVLSALETAISGTHLLV